MVTVIFVISGQGLSIHILQLPYYMLCALVFSRGRGDVLLYAHRAQQGCGTSHRVDHDVLFWLTPIIWPLEQLEGTLKHIIMLNPITYLVQGYRNAFVFDHWFFEQWEYTLYFWAFMIVFALLTAYLFAKLKDDFADIL